MSRTLDAYHLAQMAARRLRNDLSLTLLAVKVADGSVDRIEVRRAKAVMGQAFILAGWKPRVRVPCGRREWSL